MTLIKSFLNQVQVDDVRINAKLEELSRLKAMVTKITPTLTDSSGGSGSLDKFEKTMAKIVDLEDEINASIDRYIDHKRNVSELIEQIQDADQYNVIHKRYVLGMSFEQIACDMHMTYRNVCYIHGKGLQAVHEIVRQV